MPPGCVFAVTGAEAAETLPAASRALTVKLYEVLAARPPTVAEVPVTVVASALPL